MADTELGFLSCDDIAQPSLLARRGVFFSGRFDGALKEGAMRSVAAEVMSRAPFIPVLMVSALKGAGCAELTTKFLAQMELMVPFVFEDYGQFTDSTYGEVEYCLEHQEEVQCLPLKLYRAQRWPPVPPDCDGGRRGAAQNELFFGMGMLYREFPIHNEEELSASKAAMADCIIDRFLELHPHLRDWDLRQMWAPKRSAFVAGEHVQHCSKDKGRWQLARVTEEKPFSELNRVAPSTSCKALSACHLDVGPWLPVKGAGQKAIPSRRVTWLSACRRATCGPGPSVQGPLAAAGGWETL